MVLPFSVVVYHIIIARTFFDSSLPQGLWDCLLYTSITEIIGDFVFSVQCELAHKQIQSVVDKMRVDLQKKSLKLHILISGFLLDVFLHCLLYTSCGLNLLYRWVDKFILLQ